jgi:hypothetical protein
MWTTLDRGERTERRNEDETDDEAEMTTCRRGSGKAARAGVGSGWGAPARVVAVSSALTLAVTGAASVLAGCGDQPKANCLTSTASYAMKLIEMTRSESVPGACADFGPAAFDADPEVGFVSYYPQDAKGQPNYAKGSLAIQTTEIGNLFFNAEANGVENTATDGTRYSIGPYSVTEPNSANLCPVPTLSPTHVILADIPAVPDDPTTPEDDSVPEQKPVDAELVWSNVSVYLTAASFGTQVQADLVDTRKTPAGDSCTINYRTVSLAPAVPCTALDADGNPLTNPDGTPMLDPTLCDPDADPSKGRFTGSGISPDVKYVCDPVSAYCVIDGDTVPALK